jgi:DNA replication protein
MSGERFPGFLDRPTFLPVPVTLFGSLLRDIDSLAELKLTLHCWRLIQAQKGRLRYVRRSQLAADRTLLLALRSGQSEPPDQLLARALEAACQRGTLLAFDVRAGGQQDCCYFLNSPGNRQALEQIQAGELTLGPLEPARPASPTPALPRPGIYELYEQNVGLLTPLLAEELREAELRYAPEWIEDAFREAVAYNRRNWRYIHRILENWATRGRGERGEARGRLEPPEDAGRYLEGRYGRLLKR